MAEIDLDELMKRVKAEAEIEEARGKKPDKNKLLIEAARRLKRGKRRILNPDKIRSDMIEGCPLEV